LPAAASLTTAAAAAADPKVLEFATLPVYPMSVNVKVPSRKGRVSAAAMLILACNKRTAD
jgi:hypothetical protein